MNTVWKTVLKPVTTQDVELPVGAKPLHVAAQGDDICVWWQVNTDAVKRSYKLHVYGTGHPMPDDVRRLKHLGTAHLVDNHVMGILPADLVFHVFLNSTTTSRTCKYCDTSYEVPFGMRTDSMTTADASPPARHAVWAVNNDRRNPNFTLVHECHRGVPVDLSEGLDDE